MKTLKKTLCVVLAVVMAVGTLAITASATDFADDANITYDEAVEVLTGLGIIDGKENNRFDPEGTLTRAEGAKIITYALLGPDTADLLRASSAPFDDVAASNWAAGSIEYCVSQGIIAGVGDNNFDPQGTLTGVAFAKMFLVALGIEGQFENTTAWDTNVVLAAERNDLAAGTNDFDYYDAISREEACQMAFNAINVGEEVTRTSTKYVVSITENSSTTTKIYDSYSEAAAAVNAASAAGNPATLNSVSVTETYAEDSIAYTVFDLVKSDTTTVDAFGRPASVWVQDTEVIATCPAAPVATFTTAVSADQLYNTLGYNAKIVGASSRITTLDTTNGYITTAGNVVTSDITVSAKSTAIGGNGIITEIYNIDDRNTADTVEYAVIQIRPTLVKLGAPTNVAATNTNGAHNYYTVSDGTNTVQLTQYTTVVNSTTDKTNYTTDSALARDQYILVYGNATAGYTVKHPTQVTGALTGYNSATQQYSVAGVAYGLSAANDQASLNAVSGASYTTPSTFIVDSYGYLVGTYTATVPDNYVYIASQNGYEVSTITGNRVDSVIMAKAIDVNGVVSEITVATVRNGNQSNAATTSNVVAGLYTYTVDTTGKYNLTPVTFDTNTTLNSATPEIVSGVYGNTATKYIIVNWTSGTASDYDRVVNVEGTNVYYKLSTPTIVTGYNNLSNMTNVDGSYINATGNDNIAEVVFVYTNGTAGASADYIYYLGSYSTADGRTFSYNVIRDGVVTTMTSSEITSGIDTTTAAGLMSLTDGTAEKVQSSKTFANYKALYCTANVTYTIRNTGGLLYASASAADSGLTTASAYLAPISATAPVYTVSAATGAVTVGTAADLTAEVTANQVAIFANDAGNGIGGIWLIVA